MISKEDALKYHSGQQPGKIEVATTKPCITQRDLALAYTPGVAEPCWEIEKNPDDVFKYTAKGNLVAVVSNGTAVLGLGDIGAAAGKPVMEGKGVLFKRFADIDVFDIELDSHDPQEIIRAVKLMEPTFGGINLEDIKAPECFIIEEELKRTMNIPVFHDDQHGTAIISGAGLLNAAEITGRKLADMRIVVSGAGAAGLACAKFYVRLGARKSNIFLCDSKGVVYVGRKEGMNPYKEELAVETEARTLADALKGADVFCGLSRPNLLSKEMVRSMANNPIIFAMANPDPEITYEDAKSARDDVIIATGRSDYPNQVNNVLGFPFIFRGALDVRATAITEGMKVAAARALADLTKEPVPYSVIQIYRGEKLEFGREYIIPKPFDPRVLIWEAAAVAEAAIKDGVARIELDIAEYKEKLEARLGMSRKVMRKVINRARSQPKRIVYPEGEYGPILKACEIVLDEGMAHPILLGNEDAIRNKIDEAHLNLDSIEIVDPKKSEKYDEYAKALFELRQRKGVTASGARRLLLRSNYFAAMMVRTGDADGIVSGMTTSYPETIRPALQVIGVRKGVTKVAGLYMIVSKDRTLFFADATVNIEPTASELAEIALLSVEEVKRFGIEPRVAMLSFTNFGSASHPLVDRVREATRLVHEQAPDLLIDGEMQGNTAVSPTILNKTYPFSKLAGTAGANVLIFPNLEAGNIATKLVPELSGAEVIGPILLGMNQPAHVLQVGDTDELDVVNMTAIAVMDAQAGESPADS